MKVEAYDRNGPIECEMTCPPPIGLRRSTDDKRANPDWVSESTPHVVPPIDLGSIPRSIYSKYAS